MIGSGVEGWIDAGGEFKPAGGSREGKMATDATTPLIERRIVAGEQNAKVFDDGYFRIEHDNYYVACDGESITLSLKEFLIISRLARNPGRIVASEEIWRYAWGPTGAANPATLRVHINHLRTSSRLSRSG